MRLVLPLAALALLAAPAFAQSTPPAALVAPVAVQPAAPVHHHRMTMQERFDKANTTHDGHLTLAQAKTGYRTVARHFAAIDTAKKGYVTIDDIKAWEKAERDRRHATRQAASVSPKG